jgi:hypothetical protein
MAGDKRGWRVEADSADQHKYGMCRNGKGGLGCAECSPGYDHYPEGSEAWPENLDDIKGVTFIPAERID